MKKLCAIIASVGLALPLAAYDKAANLKDTFMDIRSRPVSITETIYNLSDENGKLVEVPTLRKNVRYYDWQRNDFIMIQYNDSGRPYLYEKLHFTADGLLETYQLKTKSGTTNRSYLYNGDYSGYELYSWKNDGEKVRASSFQVEREDDGYVSFEYSYNTNGKIVRTKKTINYNYTGDLRKDAANTEKKEATVSYYYYTDGKLSSIIVEKDSATRQRRVYYVDNKKTKEESYELNKNGDCVKETTDKSVYVYTYSYDAQNNWTQKDSFYEDRNDDIKYKHPLLRTKRDIQYGRTAALQEPAVPDILFSFDSSDDDDIDKEKAEVVLKERGSIKPFTSIKTDPIDDKKILYVVFNAPQRVNDYVENVSLVIRKKEGTVPDIYVNWKEFLNERSCYVTYRIDDEKAKTDEWLLSTDEKASFYNGDVAALLEKLRNADTFIVRTIPFNEPPCTAIFDVSALRNMDKQYQWLYSKDYVSR